MTAEVAVSRLRSLRRAATLAALSLGMALTAGAGFAQGVADCVPSPTNMPNAGYPRVCPDYRVMFKLEAPNARTVQMIPNPGASGSGLGNGPFDMTRGPDGIWNLTLGPVRPGFHDYHFLVDGLAVNDPGSDTYTVGLGTLPTWGLNRATSGFEVPEKGVDFHLAKDVPHGAVQELWYKAASTGEYRRAFVYVPPGYDKSLTTRFPVLYLQHGGTNDETSWVREGHVSFIMDNLLAEKKITPMLVVMERGYGNWQQTSAQQGFPFNPELYKSYDDQKSQKLFEQILIHDLIPTIDGRYRTRASRENRALAGLSRGAEQSLVIGLGNLDTFGAIGVFSGSGAGRSYAAAPATFAGGFIEKADMLNSRLKPFWMGAGTAEGGYPGIVRMHQDMERRGIKHVFYEAPGTAHEWATWRKHLYDFAPRLFAGK